MEAIPGTKPASDDPPYLIAVGGGKGGVGKTVLSASLGMGLAMLHKEVVVVDGDFGSANLHKVCRKMTESKSIQAFFDRQISSLGELCIRHPRFDNFKILQSHQMGMRAANLPHAQKLKLINHLRKLNADYIILDLGAGAGYHVLDLFLTADIGVIVVNPDPLSILDGYQFIKRAFFRRLMQTFNKKEAVFPAVYRFLSEHIEQHHANIEILINEVDTLDPEAVRIIEDQQRQFIPKLLINRLQSASDERSCLAIRTAAKALLSVDVDYWGGIQQDKAVNQALLDGEPFILHDSKARASRDLATIVITKLLKPRGIKRLHAMHAPHKSHPAPDDKTLICSVQCPYWTECELKNGGYPCELGGL